MANNRMFLVHVPSGLGVNLGKRMAYGWYVRDENGLGLGSRLSAFYAMIEAHPEWEQDAFALAMEDADRAMEMPPWSYGPMEGGFRRFYFLPPPVPVGDDD
jgi:hypothetical protein